MQDIKLRDELLQVEALVFPGVVSKEDLNPLRQFVVLEVCIHRIGINAFALGADNRVHEMAHRKVVRCGVDDELL